MESLLQSCWHGLPRLDKARPSSSSIHGSQGGWRGKRQRRLLLHMGEIRSSLMGVVVSSSPGNTAMGVVLEVDKTSVHHHTRHLLLYMSIPVLLILLIELWPRHETRVSAVPHVCQGCLNTVCLASILGGGTGCQ